MTVKFSLGWDNEVNNNAVPKMNEASIRQKVTDALTAYNGNDPEFKHLKSMGLGVSSLTYINVTKGLHQEQGNLILADSHVTVEYPCYPNPKRFHIFMWYVKKNKKLDWYPYKMTYIVNGINAVVSADI
ncbi:hypothetical protein DOJK_01006 [Patescibacteria group bacterium]|nr:hypothetical protein DOJK_01006 [Patescibacteria group bacterium]